MLTMGSKERLLDSRYRPSQLMLYLSTLCAYLTSLLFGFTIGYSSTGIPSMMQDGLIDSNGASWFGSLVNIGGMFGCPLAGCLMDRFGRRSTLLYGLWPFLLGYAMISQGATDDRLLYVGRLLSGVGMGMASVTSPVYVSEISTAEKRGLLGSGVQLSITLGILMSYVFGNFSGWYMLACIGMGLPVLAFIITYSSPESPRYYILKGWRPEAMVSLRILRGAYADVEDEMRDIEESIDVEQVEWKEFRKPELKRPLQVAMGLMMLQQLSGINVVMFYTVDIFESAGMQGYGGQATVIVGITQVVFTLVACVLMDRAGRRVLLIIAGLGMAVSNIALAFYYHLLAVDSPLASGITSLCVASLVIYIIAFSLGWGPIPGLVMSEIFPIRARASASGMTALVGWATSFVITKVFSDFEDAAEISHAFLFFGVACVAGIVFVYRILPETKGKRLEDIELYFLGAAAREV